MATNTLLLRVNPTPRNLAHSKEIFQRLKQFGEIAMFRQLRHEATTLQMTSEAFVVYKSPEAFRNALEARHLNVQVPASLTSPEQTQQSFDIDITNSDFDHAKKIEADLFRAASMLHSATGDFAPGVSLAFPPDVTPLSGERLDKKVQLATDGGWSTWRNEMQIGGVKDWASIPAIADAGFLEEAARSTKSVSSAWGAKKSSRGREGISTKPLSRDAAVGKAVENPTPLPLDKARTQVDSPKIQTAPGRTQTAAASVNTSKKTLSDFTVDRQPNEIEQGHIRFKPPSAKEISSSVSSTTPSVSDDTIRKPQSDRNLRSPRHQANFRPQVSRRPQVLPRDQTQSSNDAETSKQGPQIIHHRVRLNTANQKSMPENVLQKDSAYKLKLSTTKATQVGMNSNITKAWRPITIRKNQDASRYDQQPSATAAQVGDSAVDPLQQKVDRKQSRMSEGAKQAELMNKSIAAFAAEAAKLSQFVQSSPPPPTIQAPSQPQQSGQPPSQPINNNETGETPSVTQELQASEEAPTKQQLESTKKSPVQESTPINVASDVEKSRETHKSADAEKPQHVEPPTEVPKRDEQGPWWKLW